MRKTKRKNEEEHEEASETAAGAYGSVKVCRDPTQCKPTDFGSVNVSRVSM